uniref:ATP synthase subunit delta, chloroplastic n=1 Tax=Polysiphonia infestans TaxID=2006978 RepID=A0A1Z1MF05_9FLOR|nr:ATP synthase CF1 subunit delta [Polysiphonia infestans]ARW64351.1 ATP synthase CF1 subunit delta [Polysiphonia infestans]
MSNQNFEEKVAIPYAEALITNAQSLGLLTEYKNELSSILSILSKSKDLESFLLSPLNSNFLKKEVLKELFKDQVQYFIMNFLFVLVERRRISFLKTIIKKYLAINYSLESTIIVELFSAVDLDEDQRFNLVDKIKFLTGSSQIKLLSKQDSSLIGGFIIKVGSKVIDMSLVGKLKKMYSYLNSN